jgi:hypothetical protein
MGTWIHVSFRRVICFDFPVARYGCIPVSRTSLRRLSLLDLAHVNFLSQYDTFAACYSPRRAKPMEAKAVTPILNVSDIAASFAWFEKWGWKKLWDWGSPPTFGAVGSGEACYLPLPGRAGRARQGFQHNYVHSRRRSRSGQRGVDVGVGG